MILVTGGTGLVGSHLLYQLVLQDAKIRAIYRNPKSLEGVKRVFSYYTESAESLFEKIDWVQADIEDIPALTEAFKDVDLVYHCAGIISFDRKAYLKMRKTNINGTANMVNLSIDFGIKKFCFVSSIATLEDMPNNTTITEENEWSGVEKNGYSITKYGAEQEVWRGSQEDLDVVIINPGIILGPGFWRSGSGQMFSKINKGLNFYATGITGFVGVWDVVKIMIALMNSEIKSERYILVSDNLSFKSVFDFIADALNVKKPTFKVTKLMAALAWRISKTIKIITRRPASFTKDNAKSLFQNSHYSSKKIKSALHLDFEPISEVIKKTAQSFRKDY